MTTARKGDFIAIEHRSSYTSFALGHKERWDWYLGRVQSATRDGVVKSAVMFRSDGYGRIHEVAAPAYMRGSWWRAYTIGAEKQARASELAMLGQEYETAETLRTAFAGAAS